MILRLLIPMGKDILSLLLPMGMRKQENQRRQLRIQ